MTTAKELMRARRRAHPPFFGAVAADARATLTLRMEFDKEIGPLGLTWQVIRLSWVADAFLAQVCYRAKARLQRFRVPLLPRILHRVAMRHSQVCIGDPVVIAPGLYLPHGQVVIDGLTTIGANVVVFPWVTIGLKAGIIHGPTLADNVTMGSGAKVLGPVSLGHGCTVGANAVVIDDVPASATVVGVPARVLEKR
jgi:serine O-acetyltransferase